MLSNLDLKIKLENSENLNQTPRKELLLENQFDKSWWTTNFFLKKPVLFGTWSGVFSSCLIHLLGIIPFIRSGWMVGNAGILGSISVIFFSVTTCLFTVISAIHIAEVYSYQGTIHFCLSNVLGSRLGGSISIIYCFGQAVSCALHVTGFSEYTSELFDFQSLIGPYYLKEIFAIMLVLALFIINVAGVKWVVRLQYVLLATILLSVFDFIAGLIKINQLKNDVEPLMNNFTSEIVGFNIENIKKNLASNYEQNVNYFVVFGVFFPSVTGIFAGINMSGDLEKPKKSIPLGTFSAIFVALLVYLTFAIGLGFVCLRSALKFDIMLIQKVSLISWFLLVGIYVSTMSSSLGNVYSVPRIIQNMANEGILPKSNFLNKVIDSNHIPINAMIIFCLVSILFVFINELNKLATIVTISFLLTYCMIEYSYFCLIFTINKKNDEQKSSININSSVPNNKDAPINHYGTLKVEGDFGKLFSEKIQHRKVSQRPLSSPEDDDYSSAASPDFEIKSIDDSIEDEKNETNKIDNCNNLFKLNPESNNIFLLERKNMFFKMMSNHYLILSNAVIKIFLIFFINWQYSLAIILVNLLCWLYMGKTNANCNPGCSEFNLIECLKNISYKCTGRKKTEYDQIIISSSNPNLQITSTQMNDEGTDFISREKYHQSTTSTVTSPP